MMRSQSDVFLRPSVSQSFHGPAPRSPLHRLAVRLRHSRSNTSTEYSLPGSGMFLAKNLNHGQDTRALTHSPGQRA